MRTTLPACVIFALFSAQTVACSSNVDTVSDGGGGAGAHAGGGGMSVGGGGGSGGGDAELTWQSCSLYDGEDDGRAECATLERPLLRDDPGDERKIGIFAKRLLSSKQAEAQLWLLHGGPGASGTIGFPPIMDDFQARYPELDVYTLDHRGTGFSGYLGCPDQESPDSESGGHIVGEEWDQCIAYLKQTHGDALDGYTTSASAHDVADLIDATREPGKKVFVWGGSYGTYIGHRYMQLHPDQPDGVILEAILSNQSASIGTDEGRNAAGLRLLDVCASDPECGPKLGGDPTATLAALLDKLDQGHCPQLNLSRAAAKYLLAWLTWYHPLNSAVPALIYRLDRCEMADMQAVVAMWNNVFGGDGDLLGTDDKAFSVVLSQHVMLSEIYWDPALDGADLDAYFSALEDSTLFAFGSGAAQYDIYAEWPRYAEPLAKAGYADYDRPLLLMQGALDGATPLEQAAPVGQAFTGPNQTYVEFPYAPHNVHNGTPMAPGYDAEHCGMSILQQYLRDPTAQLDQSCVADALPPNFAGDIYLAQYVFGTDDVWENAVAANGPPMITKPPAELSAAIAALRRDRARHAGRRYDLP